MVSLLDYFNMGTMPERLEEDIVATDVYGRPIRRGPSLNWMRGGDVGAETQRVPPAAQPQPDLIDALVSIARRRAAAQPAPEVNTARDALAKGLNAGAAAGTAFSKRQEPSFIEKLLGISPANAKMLNITPEQRRELFPSSEEIAQAASMKMIDDTALAAGPTPNPPGYDSPSGYGSPSQAPAPTPVTPSVDDSGPGFFASIGEILRSPEVQYLLDVMASPAFQDPRGLSAGIVGGAADVRAQRAAQAKIEREARAKAQEQAVDIQKELIKARGTGGELYAKESIQKLIQQTGQGFEMNRLLNNAISILGMKDASGIVPELERSLKAIGNFFGFDTTATAKEDIETIANRIKENMASAGTFGRELSPNDYTVVAKVIKEPGLLQSDETVRKEFRNTMAKVQRGININMNILRAAGVDTAMIFATPEGQYVTGQTGSVLAPGQIVAPYKPQ